MSLFSFFLLTSLFFSCPPFWKYVIAAAERIKNSSHWEVDVEVDQFHVKSGANRLRSGLFMGRTGIYADLNHIIVRITPKFASEARENSILVSSHIDTVFSTYVYTSLLITLYCSSY